MMRMLWVMMGMFVPFVAPSLTVSKPGWIHRVPPSKTPGDLHSGRKGYAWMSPGPRGRHAVPRPTPPSPLPIF